MAGSGQAGRSGEGIVTPECLYRVEWRAAELTLRRPPRMAHRSKALAFEKLIQHGTADCNVPPQQGKLLADALTPLIGADKVTYTLVPGAGHGGSQFSAAENQKLVLDFLAKALK